MKKATAIALVGLVLLIPALSGRVTAAVGPFNRDTSYAGSTGDCLVYHRVCYAVGDQLPVVANECDAYYCTWGEYDDCD